MGFQIKFTHLSSLAGLLLASNLESSFKTTTRPRALMTALDRFENSQLLVLNRIQASYSLKSERNEQEPIIAIWVVPEENTSKKRDS